MCYRLAILALCLIGAFASESAWANRYYSPETGRFVTRDPTGKVGGINLYQYTESMITKAVDPMGLLNHVLAGPPLFLDDGAVSYMYQHYWELDKGEKKGSILLQIIDVTLSGLTCDKSFFIRKAQLQNTLSFWEDRHMVHIERP